MIPKSRRAEDAQAQARLVGRLRATGTARALALAERLTCCSPSSPCRTGACLPCGRAFQRAAAACVGATIQAGAPRGRMTALTTVPGLCSAAPGGLTADGCRAVGEAVRAALRVQGIGPALLALDVSFNDDLTGQVPAHWAPHAHGVASDWLTRAQKKGLRAAFPPTRRGARPVRVEPFDGNPAWPLYAFEPERERRESYLDAREGDGREPHRNTRSRALRPAQAVELALVEHALGLRGRLIAHEIDEAVIERHFGGLVWPRDGP